LDKLNSENEDLQNNIELLNNDLETLQSMRESDQERFEEEITIREQDME
jgi:peptidoglycan hydrolase CwlO-like protein